MAVYKTQHTEDNIGKLYGSQEQLEIVGYNPITKYGQREYYLKCAICDLDNELFGNQLFTSNLKSLNVGSLPCGCGELKNRTPQQLELLVRRQCQKVGLNYLGKRVNKDLTTQSKIILECDMDKHTWESCTVSDLLNGKASCRICRLHAKVTARKSLKREKRISHLQAIKEQKLKIKISRLLCNLPENSKLTFSHQIKGENMFIHDCPVCELDAFSKAGISDCKFIVSESQIKLHGSNCRCCKRYRFNTAEREFQVLTRIREEKLRYKFLGWQDRHVNAHSKILLNCPDHGNFKIKVHSFLRNRQGCRYCSTRGFDSTAPATLYVLFIEGTHKDFIGYGISGNISKRLALHKKNIEDNGMRIANEYLFSMQGEQAQRIEQTIKAAFPRNPQEIEGFKTEATFVQYLNPLLDFIKNQN